VIDLISVASIARLHVPTVGRRSGRRDARTALADLSAGARAVATMPDVRLVIASLGLQTFVRGLLTVLVVVTAIELLGLGDAGVGTLNAMMGLGGLLGSIAAITLAGRERLGPPVRGRARGVGGADRGDGPGCPSGRGLRRHGRRRHQQCRP
jgi:hypothetical protein